MLSDASLSLGRCWCLRAPKWSGWQQDGSPIQRRHLWYLPAIENKAPKQANLRESLLGINYKVNGTLKAERNNWAWKAYIFYLYWCGDADIKKPLNVFRRGIYIYLFYFWFDEVHCNTIVGCINEILIYYQHHC